MAYNRATQRNDPAPASTALVARVERPAIIAGEISQENWQILTDVIWPGAKDPNVIVTAFNYCKARKLDPFKRPVHIVSAYSSALRRSVETIWPGIGELETTAARTGVWAGMDAPVWGAMVKRTFRGVEKEWNSDRETEKTVTMEFPESCSVTVYRLVQGSKVGFTEPVFWVEAYGRVSFRSELPNDRWTKAPRQMLQKCAKAAALRAAFPEDIGNDYTSEEMEGQTIEGRGSIIEHETTTRPAQRAEKVQSFPLGSVPGSGIEPDPRSDRDKNLDARDEINRATTQTKPKATPQTKALPPQDEASSSDQPNYPFSPGDGQVYDFHTGTEYLNWVRDKLKKIAGQPDLIRQFGDAQKDHLREISDFDPSAAVDAGELIEIAMREPAT